MKKNTALFRFKGTVGICGSMETFLSFAPANILFKISFADVLNEETGQGYQRPCHTSHSQDFRRYILKPNTSTIPLTFNLRNEYFDNWKILRHSNNSAELLIFGDTPCLSQVDCQHRIGALESDSISLAFMTYIGLDLRAEMALFNIINSKAKGISSSLTDYHESNLLNDLCSEAPYLYIARKLNEDSDSPWFRKIRYGGETSSGLKRRTSLRMMQKAIQKLLKTIPKEYQTNIDDLYSIIMLYWKTVQRVFPLEWADHRHNLLIKGVGLHSLTYLLADLLVQFSQDEQIDKFFYFWLSKLKGTISWSSSGMFAPAGGRKGAIEVYLTLKKAINI